MDGQENEYVRKGQDDGARCETGRGERANLYVATGMNGEGDEDTEPTRSESHATVWLPQYNEKTDELNVKSERRRHGEPADKALRRYHNSER